MHHKSTKKLLLEIPENPLESLIFIQKELLIEYKSEINCHVIKKREATTIDEMKLLFVFII
jgi:hypothetical protein